MSEAVSEEDYDLFDEIAVLQAALGDAYVKVSE
jgi:hypothetical protein